SEIVEDLRARMGSSGGPSQGPAGLLDSVADILAGAFAHFTHDLALGPEHRTVIAAIGARLFATDEEFCRLVDMVAVERVAVDGSGNCRQSRRRLEGLFPAWLEIGPHAFAATLAAKAAFLVATKADSRVKVVGAVDPGHTSLELGGNVESEVDIPAPQRRRKAIAGIVGELDGLFGRAEAHGHQNRPKDLLGNKRIAGRNI